MQNRNHKAGFTLVELSVVILIIGLIIGGIFTGQSLLRASKLQAIISDYERFNTAVNGFYLKYSALPGDMRNAQTIWGAAADCSSAQTSAATCNGNGNGTLENWVTAGAVGNELFLFWKHLANAGFIQGSFSGVTGGSNEYSATANNTPGGKFNGSLWNVGWWSPLSGETWAFDGIYDHLFIFGLETVNNNPASSVITPAEMWAMDTKIDDGKPGTGNLRTMLGSYVCAKKADGITAATSGDAQTAIYDTDSSNIQCVLLFPNLFK